MKLDSLEALYVHSLKDLYSAENQILEALPKMIRAASGAELKSAFQLHLEQTRGQVQRLEQIFEGLSYSPGGKHCKGMEGLIKEGEDLIKEENITPDVMDAGLLAAAQHVEHYEIAGYGTARTYAEQLGYHEAARLLQQTLDEEGDTNKKLTMLAESHINSDAQA